MKKNVSLLALAIIFSCQLLTAQNFITQWNLATLGSGATQLSITTATSGTVNYTWQQVPSGASGSGSWSGGLLTITGLPTGATIRLQIAPANFQRIFFTYGEDANRLTQIEQWGSIAWTSMEIAFLGCANLQVTATDVPNLSGVNSLSRMFQGCTNLNSPANINTWNTAAVTNMSGMFYQASAFNQNVGAWNTAAVTYLSYMFYQASAFNQNIGAWNTGAVTNMSYMFSQASAFNQNMSSWNTTAVTDMSWMFAGASAFNQNIGSWNTAAVTDMSYMFFITDAFNQNIGSWNTGAVTNMSYMFSRASAFNQNIGSWNTAAVTDMSRMFESASVFNQNIGAWNTAAVTDMSYMFFITDAFNQNIGSWNTAAVTNMSFMFCYTDAFNQNIGSWNTAIVTNMRGMFSGASAFNQNIDAWNTAAVTNMSFMFYKAIAFNQNIGSWTLNPGVDLSGMLDNSGMDCNIYSETLIGWNANSASPNGRTLGASLMKYGTSADAARINLTGAKGWAIFGDAPSGSYCGAILVPVTWLYVNGLLKNNSAIIKWATTSETNTNKFEIEHSTNGINFNRVGTRDAAGNSSSSRQYEFIHTSPLSGKNYYRIKQIDIDGRFSYSAIVQILKRNGDGKTVIAPNPASQEVTIYFDKPMPAGNLSLYNGSGQMILQQRITEGSQQQNLSLLNLPAGIYQLQVQTDETIETFKLMKQ